MSIRFDELFERLKQTGRAVTVEFVKPAEGRARTYLSVDDLEGYAEAGMRATLRPDHLQASEDMAVFQVDYAPFDEYNQAFESANYYDKQQKPCLTARQAGFYKPQETLYLTASQPIGTILNVIEDGPTLALYEAWKAQNGGDTYVAFLEKRVLAHDPAFAATSSSAEPEAPESARRAGPRC